MFKYKFRRYKKKIWLSEKKKRDQDTGAEEQRQKQEYWFFYGYRKSYTARVWLDILA